MYSEKVDLWVNFSFTSWVKLMRFKVKERWAVWHLSRECEKHRSSITFLDDAITPACYFNHTFQNWYVPRPYTANLSAEWQVLEMVLLKQIWPCVIYLLFNIVCYFSASNLQENIEALSTAAYCSIDVLTEFHPSDSFKDSLTRVAEGLLSSPFRHDRLRQFLRVPQNSDSFTRRVTREMLKTAL